MTGTSPISVLYVDDERELLSLGKIFLEQSGEFAVTTALSAKEGLDLLLVSRFDAVISDYLMPEMDGIDFLKEVRVRHGPVPFILFTGKGREEIVILAINQGADFYLQKGGEPKSQFVELAHKVKQAVGKRDAELALQESERRYRSVIEDQTEFIARVDTDKTFLFANEAFCRYFKTTREAITGKRFELNIHPADQDRVNRQESSLSRERPLVDFECRVLSPEGATRWHHWNARAICGISGPVIEYQYVGRDITDRKTAENFYLATFENSGTATIIIEEDCTISYANSAFESLAGYRKEEVIGKNWTVYIDPRDLGRMMEYHQIRRENPSLAPRNYEFRFVTKSGETRSIYLTIGIIPETRKSVAALLDITDMRQVESSLRESEEKFRTLAESTTAAILIYQDDWWVYANRAVEQISGYSPEELTGMKFWDLVSPERQDLIREKGRELLLEGARGIRTESEFISKTGERIHVDLTADPVTYQGRPAVIVTAVDITRRKLAEETLKESERKYRSIFDSFIDLYYSTDMKGIITELSPSLTPLTGYTPDELIGKDVFVVYSSPGQREDLLKRLAADGFVNDYETLLRKKDGTIVPVSVNSRILRDEKGNAVSVEGTIRDITQRKKSEEALRASEERYRSVIEQMQSVFYRADLSGKLLMVSPSFVRVLGYDSQDDVLGLSVADSFYMDPEERDAIARKIIREGSVKDHEITLRRRDGSPILISTSSHIVYDSEGNPWAIEGVFHDISERKRAEGELKSRDAILQVIANSATKLLGARDPDPAISEMLGHLGSAMHVERAFIFSRGESSGNPSDTPVASLRYEWAKEGVERWLDNPLFRNIPYREFGFGDYERRLMNWDIIAESAPVISPGDAFSCPTGLSCSVAIVPVPLRDELWGAFGFYITSSREWLPGELDALRTAAALVGEALGKKVVEQALTRSEEKFREFLEDLGDILWETDTEKRFVSMSPRVQDFLGYAPAEVMGKTPYDFMEPETADRIRKILDGEPGSRAKKSTVEGVFIGKDGRRVMFESRIAPLYDSGGRFSGIRGITRDITARKEAEATIARKNTDLQGAYDQIRVIEAELRENYQALLKSKQDLTQSEERFRTLIHASLDIIAILDGAGKIRYLNPATTRLLGYSVEQGIGTDPLIPVHPDDRERVQASLNAVYAKMPRDTPETFRYRKADGSIVYLEATGNNLLGFGGIDGIVVTARDVTDRKRAEDAVRRANEKLNLLSNVTRHDILNKITVLLGYLELAKVAKNEENIRDFIRKIDDIAQVIWQQVEFTRDYQDMGVKSPEWQNPGEILDRALQQFDLGKIEVVSKLRGLEVYADPLLEKVVYNLIDNALRYGETATRITASFQESPDELVLTFEDNGAGIPSKDKSNIFAKGFGKHTGLGLFLAREILAITGMHIVETGFPGKGARFDIHVSPGNYRIMKEE
ncbi:MAG: PAS domain S-box protein [Methanoregulaceae archaeon]